MRLFVVVPCYNEACSLAATLAALRVQSDRLFELVVVDNASTDGTRAVAEEHSVSDDGGSMHIIHEPQKGTGSAADTGFRFAIATGATHIARTDADCLPACDWVARIKHAFASGLDCVTGRLTFRTDDFDLRWIERAVLGTVQSTMRGIAPLLSHNRGAQYKTRYVMVAGGNFALTAGAYLACGGFPRIRLEDDNEDHVLMNRVRTVTARIGYDRKMLVAQSARRVKHYGIRNTILWYWQRRYKPAVIDVR